MYSVSVRMRERTFRLITLLIIALGTASCATITSNDLIHESASAAPGNQRFEGTVNVQCLVIMGYAPLRQPGHWFNRFLLKEAVEKAIAKNNLFTRIEQGPADYILDIWLDKCELFIPPMGIGEYRAKMASIWRLTRVSDGKVLVCEYLGTQGSFNEPGLGPGQKSMVAALQKLIQNGLAALSDKSNPHLSAESIAGIRTSIEPWMNNVRLNWSKLRTGMTLDEVEKTIGPVRTNGAILSYVAIKFKPGLNRTVIDDTNAARSVQVIGISPSLKAEIEIAGSDFCRIYPTETYGSGFVGISPLIEKGVYTYAKREVGLSGLVVTLNGPAFVETLSGNFPAHISWDWIDIRKSNASIFISQDYQCVSGIYLLEFIDDKLVHGTLY